MSQSVSEKYNWPSAVSQQLTWWGLILLFLTPSTTDEITTQFIMWDLFFIIEGLTLHLHCTNTMYISRIMYTLYEYYIHWTNIIYIRRNWLQLDLQCYRIWKLNSLNFHKHGRIIIIIHYVILVDFRENNYWIWVSCNFLFKI